MSNQARGEQSTYQLVNSSTHQLKNIIMKLRYLFTAILSALLFVSCSEENEPAGALGDIKLSQTYVSIPADGGLSEITVQANADWAFNAEEIPDWLTVSQLEGAAGEAKVTFAAEAFEGGREVELKIAVGSNTQFLMVRQGTAKAVMATCAEVIAGADGKTYRMPQPFMVLATQNPVDFVGTYPLPEAQMDRFMMKLSMGLPTKEEERQIMEKYMKDEPLAVLAPVLDMADLQQAKKEIDYAIQLSPDTFSSYYFSFYQLFKDNCSMNLPRVLLLFSYFHYHLIISVALDMNIKNRSILLKEPAAENLIFT